MGIIETAASPWGQTVPIHIAFSLIWVMGIAGLAFLMGHAIWYQFAVKGHAQAVDVDPALAAKVPDKVQRHSLAARMFHWVMAAAMLTLLFTAFLPRVGYPFAWVEYHWIAGLVLTTSIIYHVIHATFFMDPWSIWPDKIDIEDAQRRLKRAQHQLAPSPRKFAKYPLENKMYHMVIVLAGLERHHHRTVHDEARAHASVHP